MREGVTIPAIRMGKYIFFFFKQKTAYEMLSRIVRFIHEQGSVAGMQLAHAGRKASTYRPWEGHGTIPENRGGWKKVVAPSALAFADHYPIPQALTSDGIQEIVAAFANAARRA